MTGIFFRPRLPFLIESITLLVILSVIDWVVAVATSFESCAPSWKNLQLSPWQQVPSVLKYQQGSLLEQLNWLLLLRLPLPLPLPFLAFASDLSIPGSTFDFSFYTPAVIPDRSKWVSASGLGSFFASSIMSLLATWVTSDVLCRSTASDLHNSHYCHKRHGGLLLVRVQLNMSFQHSSPQLIIVWD